MRLAIFSLIVSGLIAATGCSASQARPASPVTTNIADTSSDSSWTPPSEMDFAFDDGAPTTQAPSANPQAMPQPNRRQVLRNQIHPATY